MVKPKRRIPGAVEEIGACVAAHRVVAGEVHPQFGAGGLHAVLEGGDGVGVEDEVGDGGVGAVCGGVGVDVAAETAGVGAEAVGLGVWWESSLHCGLGRMIRLLVGLCRCRRRVGRRVDCFATMLSCNTWVKRVNSKHTYD